MTTNNVKNLYDRAKSYYNSGDMVNAAERFYSFVKEGREHLSKTMDRWYENKNILDAESLFKAANSWFEEGEPWLSEGKDWIEKVREKTNGGKDADRIRWKFAECWYYWGFTLAGLARVENTKKFCDKARELFLKAIECYDESIRLDWCDMGRALVFKGAACFRLSLIEDKAAKESAKKKEIDYAEKAKECFMRSEKSVLDILVALDYDVEEELVKSTLLYDMLGDRQSADGSFFDLAVQGVKMEDDVLAYKRIYIRSLYIISWLYVDSAYEKDVASYREMRASRKLLNGDEDGKNKFRLTAIDYSNDPTEGEVLIDSLTGVRGFRQPDVDEYGVFAACFTFNRDSLNMFRLYGKGSGAEGTGLSLVFKSSFFSERIMLPAEPNESGTVDGKLTLFRCIYFNPNDHRVESVGKLDSEFFGNNQQAEKKRYDGVMKKVLENVDGDIKKLRDEIKARNLDKHIVNRLLINLRYLVKSSCFKEEQECRILKIYNLKNDADKIDLDENCNLCVYYEPKVSEYVTHICFGPKAMETERFKDFLKYKGLKIDCKNSVWRLA